MPVTIDKPSKYFNTILNTGNNTSPKAITGFGFQPDLVWSKTRTSGFNHTLFDSVRGAGSNKELMSNSTSAEGGGATGSYGYISTFDSDGFTAITGSVNFAYFNYSGDTYVNWGWKANGAGVSNTAGTITSTVSANTTSGFSIVSYTGTGATGTVGHGLGVAPKMVIYKNRSSSTFWYVYHKDIGNNFALYLNATNAKDSDPNVFQSTDPSSSLLSVGVSPNVNGSGNNIIAYCFAEIKGYSKFGSYTGNGSTDGTFVYTGFKPAFILIKRTNTTSTWHLSDNKRIGYNPLNYRLEPNNTNTEYTGVEIYHDMLSNGFKCRATDTDTNGSGSTYIYMAFAENPFCSSKGIPTTAR
jgi:hypothetical protein